MKKFALSVIVITSFVLLLAACASAPAAAPAPTSAPAAIATTAPAAAPTTAAATTAPAAAPTTAAATTAPAATGDKVTLTYIASQGWIEPAEQDLAKKFEDQTGIHIDYQIIPADQYFNVLQTKLNSGEGPDIFGGQSGKSDLKVTYNVEQNAVDLTDQEWTKRIDPLALDQTSLDGKVYGAEIWDIIGSNYFIVNYNKDIFNKLGLSVPKNFADFKAACTTIKAAGIKPVFEPISDGWHHVLWFPMIGPRFEQQQPGLAGQLNANKAKFADNANMLTALTQLQDLYTSGCFGDNALSDKFSDTSKAMAGGEYAMTLSTLTAPVGMEKDFPTSKASNFGFFPIPLDDNQLPPAHPAGPSKFIYSKSPHVDQAKQYLAFLMQPENLQYLLDNTPAFSALDFSGLKTKWTPEQQAFLDAYPPKTIVYQDAVNYVNPQWIDIGKDMVAMFTGAMQPKDVLVNIDQRRADMAKTAKDPAWNQ